MSGRRLEDWLGRGGRGYRGWHREPLLTGVRVGSSGRDRSFLSLLVAALRALAAHRAGFLVRMSSPEPLD